MTFAHTSDATLPGELSSVRSDGRVLAVGTEQGVAFWDLATRQGSALPADRTALHLMFRGIGRPDDQWTMGVWRWPVELDSGREEFRVGPPKKLPFPARTWGIDEDSSGRIMALANYVDAPVHNCGPGTPVGPLQDCRSVAVSPDGQWLATGSHGENGAQVWRIGNVVPRSS